MVPEKLWSDFVYSLQNVVGNREVILIAISHKYKLSKWDIQPARNVKLQLGDTF